MSVVKPVASPSPEPQEVRSAVSELRKLLARQAAELAQLARDSAQQVLQDGKARTAAQITAVGGAVRRAADKLHDQDSGALADYVDNAADRVEDVARHIDERDLGELAKDAEAIARRKPLLFLGGMFVAGVASVQLLKAMNRNAGPADPVPADGAAERPEPPGS